MTQNILKQIIEHWKKEFTGTSALEIAEAFKIPHNRAKEYFQKLVAQELISIQEAKLGQPIKFKKIKMGNVNIKMPEDWEMVDTLIAFPKRRVLEEVFTKECKDYGVYTNRLHRGDSQIKHYFFKYEVLDKYFKYPERYHINDDIIGGYILTKDEYYFSLPESTRDEKTFAKIEYGKRKLQDSRIVIAVIVSDLSSLPEKEQHYWLSFEIENPKFAKGDTEFEKYWRENFEAEFLDHEDLLNEILTTVKNINRISDQKIFKKDSGNSYLRYPVVNNREAYRNAHKELFKIIGRDSLNKEEIKKILKEYLNIPEKDVQDKQGKEKGQWALFKMLAEKVGISLDPFNQCHDARTETSHFVNEARLEKIDFIQQFRSDCAGILEGLKKIELFFNRKQTGS